MNNFKYNPIKMTPFKWFVLENFPFIEEDFDSLTSYGLWCKLKNYFDKVATKTNEMGTQVENLTNAFNTLKDYVDNYFANLDVQEEINNKLDDMAEKGTLQEIINSYLQSNCLWVFNNVNDMKNATNIRNGSKCKTLGYYVANDGGGAEYLIRTKNEIDIDDGGSIHIIGDLVAELIIQNGINIKQFGAKGDKINDDSDIIQSVFNYAKSKDYQTNIVFPKGEYLITKSLILNIEKCNILGENACLCSNITTNEPVLILNGGNDIAPNRRIENLLFRNINSNQTDTVAIRIGYPTYDAEDEANPATHFSIKNCTFYNYGHCFVLGNNAYIFQVEKCVTWNCKYCFEDYNQYLTNSGENIVLRDCLFTNYDLAISIKSSNVQVRIENTSFDQGLKVLEYHGTPINHPSNAITFRDCHFESSKIDTPLMEMFSGDSIKLNILRCTSFLNINNDYLIKTSSANGREFNINLEDNIFNFYNNIPKYLTNSARIFARNNLTPRNNVLLNPANTNNLFINYTLGSTSISENVNKVNNQKEIVNKCWILFDGSTWNTNTTRQSSENVNLSLDNTTKPEGMTQSYKVVSNNAKSRVCYMAPVRITGTPVAGSIKIMIPEKASGELIIQPVYYDGVDVKQIGIYDTTQTSIDLSTITPNEWITINFPDTISQIQHDAKFIGYNFILKQNIENFVYYFANSILQNI